MLSFGILCGRSRKGPVSVSGRRIGPGLLTVCPGDLILGTPCFLCRPAVCPPVCLPPVSLPLQPLLFQHPVSTPPAPTSSLPATSKGMAVKAPPCLVPAPLQPHGPRPLPGSHPTLGAPPWAPCSLHLLSSGSGHSFTTFLLSCPSPRAPACSGREGSRTLFPLFKVSRLVSQEGGLPPPPCLTLLLSQLPLANLDGQKWGRGTLPGGPRPLPGEGTAET